MNKRLINSVVIPALAGLILGGCGTIEKAREASRVDYKSVEKGRSLEMPPDLTQAPADNALGIPKGSAASMADYERSGGVDVGAQRTAAVNAGVLPQPDNVRMERAGNERWLVVKAEPQAVWARLKQFWATRGLNLVKENPATGIMETDWAEHRPNVKLGGIRGFLKKHIGGNYIAGLRDKFRVRIEPGREPGTTEIYLAHSGMVERSSSDNSEVRTTYWEMRPSDPDLEAEMLRLIMVDLGAPEDKAKQVAGSDVPTAPKARLLSDGSAPKLVLDSRFDNAWRQVGIVLDRVGFAVQDRNREQGVYYVRYDDPAKSGGNKGFFKKVFGGKKKAANNVFQVKLADHGETTSVIVLTESGAAETSGTGEKILKLLLEQLQ
ncbi:MAG: hypothetical protein DSZ32_05350 [Gammaproteobacteria bacterium]|nr:MAG: hypothetical protein DSZ32_05350 [Gammaproteobacteria bacterium]